MRTAGGGDAWKLCRLRQHFADRSLQADHLHRLAVGTPGQPLVMPVHHIAVRRHQDGAVAAREGTGLLHLGRRELRLRGLEVVRRHLAGAAVDASGLEEVHQGAPVRGPDLRHLGARHAQGPRLWGEGAPLAVDLPGRQVGAILLHAGALRIRRINLSHHLRQPLAARLDAHGLGHRASLEHALAPAIRAGYCGLRRLSLRACRCGLFATGLHAALLGWACCGLPAVTSFWKQAVRCSALTAVNALFDQSIELLQRQSKRIGADFRLRVTCIDQLIDQRFALLRHAQHLRSIVALHSCIGPGGCDKVIAQQLFCERATATLDRLRQRIRFIFRPVAQRQASAVNVAHHALHHAPVSGL
ncbi:MAG: hypothetical protein ABS55_04635 [Lautropia sp. SCN 70-15]|nr:MAG: hypothetical protein ABS55_04635 [Lautropia sp. SCN 70-15]